MRAEDNFEAIVKHLFDYLDGKVTEGGAEAEWMMQKKRNGNQQITGLVNHPQLMKYQALNKLNW